MTFNKELRRRLLAVGEKVKAKGWPSASIEMGVQYLAIFDRPPSVLDPMISFSPAIRSNGSTNYIEGWNFKTWDEAMTALEEGADKMPTAADEEAKRNAAMAKLSADEKKLLGVR